MVTHKDTIEVAGVKAFKRPIAASRDFRNLIGKELKMVQVDGLNLECVVDEIDYDIGISISFKGVHSQYTVGPDKNGKQMALCLPGPSAKGFTGPSYPERYNARFFSIVRGIRLGQFDAKHTRRIAGFSGSGNMASCPFS